MTRLDLLVALTGYFPPEEAPLKAAERSWPRQRPSRVRPHGAAQPAFEGHRYGLGECDAL